MSHTRSSQSFKNFGNRFFEQLEKFNVFHIEQLASLLASPTGEEAIKSLNLGEDIEEIRSAAQKEIGKMSLQGLRLTPAGVADPERPANKVPFRAMGYSFTAEHPYHFSFKLPETVAEIPGPGAENLLEESIGKFRIHQLYQHGSARMIFPDGQLPFPKDQGSRGTCVAFATTAILEAFIKHHAASPSAKHAQFSEQYLYYRAKSEDRNKEEDGTQFRFALDALKQVGVCEHRYLEYRRYNDWTHSLLFERNRTGKAKLAQHAKRTKISSYLHLPFYKIIDEIKYCLDRQLAVGVGVLVFNDAWYRNDFTAIKGEIQMPITVREDGEEILKDVLKGGHAITIYGYEEGGDWERPGGGGFIFRNSWGEDWAYNSDYSRGYGIIPYEYVRRFAKDACIITGVAKYS